MIFSKPTVPESDILTKESVWGTHDSNYKLIDKGMVIARSKDICPIWNDKVPYKSVTVICPKLLVEDVRYWLEYVHGANSVSKIKNLADNKVAIRSNYMCW